MEGGRAMQKATSGNIGRRLGVLFVEQKTKSELVTNEIGESVIEQTSYIEKNIISLATVQAVLGTSFRITGVGSPAEASELALLLRAGALAAPMKFVEERTVGPSLGKENIELGMKSIVIGFALVVLFMIFYYRVFGIAANISLILNLVLITGIFLLLYLQLLEQIIIETLDKYGLEGKRISGLTGVWVGEKKVAAQGVKISRWVTMHGFSLNVNTDLSHFDHIIPCGIHGKQVTSMAEELKKEVSLSEVKKSITHHFEKQFDATLVS